MIRRLAMLACVVCVCLLAIPVPSFAQSSGSPFREGPDDEVQYPDPFPFERDDPFADATNGLLGVRIVLSDARDRDKVELYDLDLAGRYDYDLARSVVDELGIDSSRTHLTTDDLSAFDSPSDFVVDTWIEVDGRIVQKAGDGWTLDLPLERLVRLADLYEYTGVELSICPADVDVEDHSTRAPDRIESDCSQWRATAGDATRISIFESADSSSYWTLVAVSAGISAILTIVAVVGTRLMRRSVFRHLASGTITVSIGALAVSFVASTIAMIAFAVMDRPFTDFVFHHDLGPGGAFVATVLPAMLFAMPFLVSAVSFVGALPPPGIADATAHAVPGVYPIGGVGPGVPSWLSPSQESARPSGGQSWSQDVAAPMPSEPTQMPHTLTRGDHDPPTSGEAAERAGSSGPDDEAPGWKPPV